MQRKYVVVLDRNLAAVVWCPRSRPSTCLRCPAGVAKEQTMRQRSTFDEISYDIHRPRRLPRAVDVSRCFIVAPRCSMLSLGSEVGAWSPGTSAEVTRRAPYRAN